MDFRQHIILFFSMILLVFAQVWIFNPMAIFGYATPLLYTFLLIMIPNRCSTTTVLIYSFVCGILIDILGGSPGLHTAAFTFTGFLRNYLILPFLQTDGDKATEKPGIISMGINFYLFLLLLTGVHTLSLFLLDSLQLFNIAYFLIRTIASWLATFLLNLLLYFVFGQKRVTHL